MEIHKVSLAKYCSLNIGGMADLVDVKSENDLIEVHRYATTNGLRAVTLGGGTNTYFGSHLENILVIKMELMGVTMRESDGDVYVTASAGENWDALVKSTVDKELWGLENLSLIPGTVGAAPVQNIGAYGTELKDTLVSVRVYNREIEQIVELTNSQCDFGYRDSIFKRKPGAYVIISVTMKLSSSPKPILTYKPLDQLVQETVMVNQVRDLVVSTRQSKLPHYLEYPNCGSFFKNPTVSEEFFEQLKSKYENVSAHKVDNGYKISAAWLIEHVACMKGVRVGNVGTWPNQPLVVVNYGGADEVEFNIFVNSIVEKVQLGTGIILEKEVNFVY